MKKWIFFLAIPLVLTTSCNKDEELFDEVDDQIEWEDEVAEEEDTEGSLTLYKVDGDLISKIKDYSVTEKLKPYQENVGKHFEMWDFVVRLIPADARSKISEFEVFHGEGDLQGFVINPDEQDLSRWRFGLAIDIANNLGQIDFDDLFTYVTIHEYGHVLTLNDSQVDVSTSANCSTFFTGEGCSRENTYINRLYELAWKDLEDDPLLDDPDALYNKYPNRFVTSYAATNPGEDIAEVFSFFVTMKAPPTGNKVSDQKINLLYEFPELVSLRKEIRKSDPIQSLRAGSWTTHPAIQNFRICGRKGCKH